MDFMTMWAEFLVIALLDDFIAHLIFAKMIRCQSLVHELLIKLPFHYATFIVDYSYAKDWIWCKIYCVCHCISCTLILWKWKDKFNKGSSRKFPGIG